MSTNKPGLVAAASCGDLFFELRATNGTYIAQHFVVSKQIIYTTIDEAKAAHQAWLDAHMAETADMTGSNEVCVNTLRNLMWYEEKDGWVALAGVVRFEVWTTPDSVAWTSVEIGGAGVMSNTYDSVDEAKAASEAYARKLAMELLGVDEKGDKP